MQDLDIMLLSEGQLHTTQKFYIPKDLKISTHVRLQTDRLRKPLEAPYSGPYKIIRRESKHFVIETLTSDEQTVSILRMKPAILTHAHDKNKTPKQPN